MNPNLFHVIGRRGSRPQARIDADIAAERAERQVGARQYWARIAAGEMLNGRLPAGVEVAVAEQRLAEAIAASQAKHAAHAALGGGACGSPAGLARINPSRRSPPDSCSPAPI